MRKKSTIPELQELYNKKIIERDIIHERQKLYSYIQKEDSKELKLVNNRLTNIRHKMKKIKTSE
jgi:hypothetical protein